MKRTPRQLPRISVHNRQRKVAVDCSALEEFAHRALPLCAREGGRGLTSLREINVLLISDCRMSELHHRFMQIAGPTDVITFQHGEIFLSTETAWRQATSLGTTLSQELCVYLIHGLLHLQGFDDSHPAARQQMHSVQKKIARAAQQGF